MAAGIIAASCKVFDSGYDLCVWLNANAINTIIQIVANNDGKFTLFYT